MGRADHVETRVRVGNLEGTSGRPAYRDPGHRLRPVEGCFRARAGRGRGAERGQGDVRQHVDARPISSGVERGCASRQRRFGLAQLAFQLFRQVIVGVFVEETEKWAKVVIVRRQAGLIDIADSSVHCARGR